MLKHLRPDLTAQQRQEVHNLLSLRRGHLWGGLLRALSMLLLVLMPVLLMPVLLHVLLCPWSLVTVGDQ